MPEEQKYVPRIGDLVLYWNDPKRCGVILHVMPYLGGVGTYTVFVSWVNHESSNAASIHRESWEGNWDLKLLARGE